MRAKLQAEIDAGRIAGPFNQPPFDLFQISPLKIREKKVPGKFRLIHDLSYPYNDQSSNANIPDKCKTVKCASVRDAIKVLVELPKGAYIVCSTSLMASLIRSVGGLSKYFYQGL